MSETTKKHLIIWIGITLAAMFILPLVAAKCVPPDFGMAVCILLCIGVLAMLTTQSGDIEELLKI